MTTKRKRRTRNQRDNQRDIMLRYFKGESLDRSELMRALTPTARPGRMTLAEWQSALADELPDKTGGG
jgi:hypothetical protein